MAIPASRDQLKEHCLRRLGKPVVDINVDDEQVEDRIDEALLYYRDYHFDGTERVFLKQQVTDEDKTNGYFTLDNSIIGVTSVFDIGDAIQSSNLFNIRYQIHLNDLFDFSSTTYVPYVTAMRHVEQLEEIFVGKKPIRFNRHINRLHIDMDWDVAIAASEYILIECIRKQDTTTYTDIFNDFWLKKYTTAKLKMQWGQNLIKFEGIQLPCGITLNGRQLVDDAKEEIQKLEEELRLGYELPVMDMIG